MKKYQIIIAGHYFKTVIGKLWYRSAIDPYDPENRIQFRKTLKIVYRQAFEANAFVASILGKPT